MIDETAMGGGRATVDATICLVGTGRADMLPISGIALAGSGLDVVVGTCLVIEIGSLPLQLLHMRVVLCMAILLVGRDLECDGWR